MRSRLAGGRGLFIEEGRRPGAAPGARKGRGPTLGWPVEGGDGREGATDFLSPPIIRFSFLNKKKIVVEFVRRGKGENNGG